jgi:hypothetical protein
LVKLPAIVALVGYAGAQTLSVADQAAITRSHELRANRANLAVSLTLDRDVYFPGEDAQVTIRIVNPTSQMMEVPEPFNPLTGFLSVMHRGGPLDPVWVPDQVRTENWVGIPPPPPAVWISPGQSIEKTFWLSDPAFPKNGTSFVESRDVHEREGLFRVSYSYDDRAFAQYQVVWPQFEQWTRVKFQRPGQVRDPAKPSGPTVAVSRWAWFAAVGYQGSHIIIAGRGQHTGGPLEPDPSGKFTGYMSRGFSPFRRIATSPVPIRSLQGVADNTENITLSYTDQTGRRFTLKLNANRDSMP